ncbi:hypothetical protein K3495_g17008 [Podosphaera aphanis]|nr:hypothetical protein K3495_g17008 [Podosphaera aphanis]
MPAQNQKRDSYLGRQSRIACPGISDVNSIIDESITDVEFKVEQNARREVLSLYLGTTQTLGSTLKMNLLHKCQGWLGETLEARKLPIKPLTQQISWPRKTR